MTDPLRAAGAVVWRGDERRPEVALVHRPRYDDWTFPKGKLKAGEHVIAAALREVREETGMAVLLGRALPPIHYLHHEQLKRVDYWVARATEDSEPFVPGDEVDEVRWLPVDEARPLLSYEWDTGLLRALEATPLGTVPLVLVRHGSAGARHDWVGDDGLRPLDPDGRAQAATIARVLPAYRPEVLVSSPSERCVQTLEPYAKSSGLAISLERLLSEEGHDPQRTAAVVARLAMPAAVSSHGKVLPDLIHELGRKDVHLRKGAFAVLHRLGGRVVGLERYTT
jgi:8-oxo-dGTP pyrophosphatase MutT (NUDIX family)